MENTLKQDMPHHFYRQKPLTEEDIEKGILEFEKKYSLNKMKEFATEIMNPYSSAIYYNEDYQKFNKYLVLLFLRNQIGKC
jgi:hypothetical protein